MSDHLAPAARVLISEQRIRERIATLAKEIADAHDGQELHLICVLKGAFVFTADLVRALPVPATIDFLSVSSYGQSDRSSGEVKLLQDLDRTIADRPVVLVEDIVDTGRTLDYLQRLLEARRPRSLRTVTLLSKPSRRELDVSLDWVAFEIPDRFAVGYGLDHAERHRQLPYVASLDPEE